MLQRSFVSCLHIVNLQGKVEKRTFDNLVTWASFATLPGNFCFVVKQFYHREAVI